MANIFPKWTNTLPTLLAGGTFAFLVVVVALAWYYMTPNYTRVGYQPTQPVAFSHQVHVGKLGMDCRYCHTHVEQSRHANIPSTATCMSCHTVVDELGGYLRQAVSQDGSTPSAHWRSEDLQVVRNAYAEDKPIPWRRVHKVPDYAHFNHAVHVNAGVSCYSCHKRIDQMPVVFHAEGMGMGWCLDCHRAPEKHLVEQEYITDLAAVEKMLADSDHARTVGARIAERLRMAPSQNCAACHY